MDFHSIISTAQQNLSTSREKGNFYSTKFEPPKKITKENKLRNGIQKFLEQQKREEEEKAAKERQKRLELIARRDPKEQRKIDKSLKVIKSSKKFFSGDSNLDENTAVTLENEQPDEDDYGYTSTVSDQFHKKLMEKYQKMPEDKKFTTSGKHKAMSKDEIQRTKDRVKNAFASKEEDQSFKQGAQQRTSKAKSDNKSGAGTSVKSLLPLDKRNGDKPKPKLKPAPIVDFQELMKLAAQKQHEEIIIDVPVKKEPERLLTSKEKRELEEIEAARRARQKPNRIPKLGSAKVGETSKQDKNNNSSDSTIKKPASSLSKPPPPRPQSSSADSQRKPQSSIPNSSSKLRDALQKSNELSRPSSSKMPPPSQKPQSKFPPTKSKDVPSKAANLSSQKPSTSNGVARQEKARPTTSSSSKPAVRDFPPKDLLRTREFPPKDLMRSREFPPKDLMRSREFPPRDNRLNQKQVSLKRRRIEDEESDYDSEMDDFIDDEDAEIDFSSEIKNIFGYDKSRYRDEDFDDSNMESNFQDVMREEIYSKKMGRLEDLEDMRMEEEELKRKAAMRKKRKL